MRQSRTKKKMQSQAGHIRVIGGQWRGRKLPVLDLEGLRPTTDRLKETVFNWLQFELPNANVLDVFAGTGSLGIEALSRGAARAQFLEQAPAAAAQLRDNLTRLAADTAHVEVTDALVWLQKPATAVHPYNVVFLDPPFAKALLQPSIDHLPPWLAPNAWVYIETERNANYQVPNNWHLHREKQTSQVSARLFQVQAG